MCRTPGAPTIAAISKRRRDQGEALGALGANVATKAINIYATYLVEDREDKDRSFPARRRARGTPAAIPGHRQRLVSPRAGARPLQPVHFRGQGAGAGVGGQDQAQSRNRAALEKRHADAHIALGAYHAEVVDKIGGMIAGLTYGASKEAAVKHFEEALKLNPTSAIARMEYANALAMLFGASKLKQATALYEDAARCVPADAMERLDVEAAKAEIAG